MSTADYVGRNNYGYNPNFGAGVFFCVMFGLTTLVSLAQVIHTRYWAYGVLLILGSVGELIGWVGRTISHNNFGEQNPFLMQIVCLIISPCFFSACMYFTLGDLAKWTDPRLSPLKPLHYLLIFSFADIAALVVQAIGGSKAASTFKNHTNPDDGGHIMLGGIAFQLLATIVFIILEGVFFRKAWQNKILLTKDTPRKSLLIVVLLCWLSLWILVRCIYRTVELGMGWTGYVNTHQVFFIVFDSVPMTLVCIALTALHPGYLIEHHKRPEQCDEEQLSDKDESLSINNNEGSFKGSGSNEHHDIEPTTGSNAGSSTSEMPHETATVDADPRSSFLERFKSRNTRKNTAHTHGERGDENKPDKAENSPTKNAKHSFLWDMLTGRSSEKDEPNLFADIDDYPEDDNAPADEENAAGDPANGKSPARQSLQILTRSTTSNDDFATAKSVNLESS